jgi:hypothetical protein
MGRTPAWIKESVAPAPRCPSCGEDVTESDSEQFCLDVACEEMVVEAEQPEPPDLTREVLVPMWPMFAWALIGAFVLPWSTPDATLFDLELHQQVYSLLGWPVIIYSLYRVCRDWRRAENVD